MQRCYNEKEYKSNKTDLTLKLPPCGENAAEERGLRRSSSSSLVVGVANGAQWGPPLGRSCSLPTERQRRRVAALSPQVLVWVAASSAVNVNNTPSSLHKPKALPNSSQDSGLGVYSYVLFNPLTNVSGDCIRILENNDIFVYVAAKLFKKKIR